MNCDSLLRIAKNVQSIDRIGTENIQHENEYKEHTDSENLKPVQKTLAIFYKKKHRDYQVLTRAHIHTHNASVFMHNPTPLYWRLYWRLGDPACGGLTASTRSVVGLTWRPVLRAAGPASSSS